MVTIMQTFFLSSAFLLILTCSAKQPTEEDFYIQERLWLALSNNRYARFSLRELFFPRLGETPVCSPIKYELSCNDTDFTYNSSKLWTSYDASSSVGQILLSSAYYGILVKGFDWETACNTDTGSETLLQLVLPSCDDYNITELTEPLDKQLLAFTIALKAYADGTDDKLPSGDTLLSHKAYAIAWKEPENENEVFHQSYVILSTMVAFLDFFIVVFSMGICSTVYDVIYTKIKYKKNPYYPLFIATVLCSIVWNVGPGWLVLLFDTNHIKYSFVFLIPLQLLLALFMKKYPDFPLPGFPCNSIKYTKLKEIPPTRKNNKQNKDEKYFFWEISNFKNKVKVILSFILQTIGVWSLLVLFTFIVYYSVGITISLYLYPIQTLVKVIFIKAVAVCVVFDVAILFSGYRFDFKCSRHCFVKDINDVAMLFASIALLPVIVFVAFVAGGVIFSSSATQLSGIQGVLALLPSTVLLLIGWYSKGTLFPEKLLDDADSDEKVVSDVEQAAKNESIEITTASPKKNSPAINKGEKGYGAV